jgi:hypothetical protein
LPAALPLLRAPEVEGNEAVVVGGAAMVVVEGYRKTPPDEEAPADVEVLRGPALVVDVAERPASEEDGLVAEPELGATAGSAW